MNADTTHFLDLLERRIALLGSLADALVAARSDVVSFDLDGLEGRIAHQEHLCGEIRLLDADIDQVQQRCATRLDASQECAPPTPESEGCRMQEILNRLREAQMSVKQLNDTHRHLLRRSRRTVSALLNSYRSFALTYSDPSSARVSVTERA